MSRYFLHENHLNQSHMTEVFKAHVAQAIRKKFKKTASSKLNLIRKTPTQLLTTADHIQVKKPPKKNKISSKPHHNRFHLSTGYNEVFYGCTHMHTSPN